MPVADRRLLVILPSAFIVALGIGVVNLGMIFLVKGSYGASPAVVGWFAASWSMAYFLGCLALPKLARLLNPARSMLAMTLSGALVFFLHLLLPGIASAFAAYLVFGASLALFWPPLMGWLSGGLEGRELGRYTGLFNLSWSSSSILAPYLGGLLSERDPRLALVAAIVAFAAAAAWIWTSSRLVPPPAAPASSTSERAAEAAPEPDRSTPLRFPSWLAVFLLYALAGVFYNIFPVYAKDELAMPESRIGLVLLVRALATAGGFWLFGRFGFWHFKRRYIVLGPLLGLAIALLMPFAAGEILLIAAIAAFGLTLSLSYTASIFHGASGARDRERRMTIHETLLTAGQIAGSVLGGAAYQAAGWGRVFVILGALMAAGLAAQGIMLLRGGLARRG